MTESSITARERIRMNAAVRINGCASTSAAGAVEIIQADNEIASTSPTDGIGLSWSSHMVLALTLLAPLVAADGSSSEPLCARCHCKGALLDCTATKLDALPADAARWPADVEEAYFKDNSIVHVAPLPPLPRLRVLSFRDNRIQKMDDGVFKDLPALQELDLGGNQLSRLSLRPDIFKGQFDRQEYQPLGNVTVLRLDFNSIHSLDSDVFEHIPHVKVLSLASNPLRNIDVPTVSAIASLGYLEALDLSHSYLKEIPRGMLHTPIHLHSLNLSGNAFASVPEELAEVHELKELHLSSNPIRYLERGAFPEALSSLEVLELNYMADLSRVGFAAFQPLRNLRVLHLAHSLALRSIDKDAFRGDSPPGNDSLPPLQELVLRGNSLQYLDSDLLNWGSFHLKWVDIQDNLWLCDCDMQWAVFELEKIINRTHPELLTNVICENPEPMRGQSLFSLHVRHYHLRCLDAYDAHPQNDAAVLIGVLVGVLLAVPTTLAVVIFWKRGGFAWFRAGGGGAAAYSRAFYSRTRNVDDF